MALLLTHNPTTIPFPLCCTSPAPLPSTESSPLLIFMKKIRGFKLGRRLVRLWRWVRRPSAKPTAYLRLKTTAPNPPPRSPPRQHHHDKEKTEMTTMIAHWGRSLTRRLCQTTHVSFGSTGEGEMGRRRLLGAEHRSSDHGKQQQPAEEETHHPKPPPKGHLVAYVGRKGVEPLYRVLVPVVYFNHPLFGELLRGAEREFGFHQRGGITIPCAMSDFESVRTRVAAAAGRRCHHCARPVVAARCREGSWWSS